MLLLLALLQIADGVLTHLGLNRGAKEANPVMRFLIERIGQVPALVAAKLATFGIVALIDIDLLTIVGIVLTAIVVVNNARVLARA